MGTVLIALRVYCLGRGDRMMNLDNGNRQPNQGRTVLRTLQLHSCCQGEEKIPPSLQRYKSMKKESLELKLRLRPTNFSSGHKFESEEGGKGGFGRMGICTNEEKSLDKVARNFSLFWPNLTASPCQAAFWQDFLRLSLSSVKRRLGKI